MKVSCCNNARASMHELKNPKAYSLLNKFWLLKATALSLHNGRVSYQPSESMSICPCTFYPQAKPQMPGTLTTTTEAFAKARSI